MAKSAKSLLLEVEVLHFLGKYTNLALRKRNILHLRVPYYVHMLCNHIMCIKYHIMDTWPSH